MELGALGRLENGQWWVTHFSSLPHDQSVLNEDPSMGCASVRFWSRRESSLMEIEWRLASGF